MMLLFIICSIISLFTNIPSINATGVQPEISLLGPLHNDYYQFTMAYSYWKTGRAEDTASFELFFRKNPFNGEYTVFAGLNDILEYVKTFKFSDSDINYLKNNTSLPKDDKDFFAYLKKLNTKALKIDAVVEGTVVFPSTPLVTVTGPLILCQLLETPFLNIINFATLMATNAARMRQATTYKAVKDENNNIKKFELLEFGLRRAQGPNGGLFASKFAYIGGFDATSNALAGERFGVPVRGTHAHAFVTSFNKKEDINWKNDKNKEKKFNELWDSINAELAWLKKKIEADKTSNWNVSDFEGERVAFAAYAFSFPKTYVALIDTYNTLESGLINFLAVSLALFKQGEKPNGVRLDSGKLGELSREVRRRFKLVDGYLEERRKTAEKSWIPKDLHKVLKIFASDGINEESIISLQEEGHEIDIFAVGTNLVTCQKQPALGGVYKLVEVNGKKVIKISEEKSKILIPGRKNIYRLYKNGKAIHDILTYAEITDKKKTVEYYNQNKASKQKDKMVFKQGSVTFDTVEPLQKRFWENGDIPKAIKALPYIYVDKPKNQVNDVLNQIKKNVANSIETIDKKHLDPLKPEPYSVSITKDVHDTFSKLMGEHGHADSVVVQNGDDGAE